MRVLVFTQYYWPETFGITDVVSTLKRRNIDVDVITAKPNYPDGKFYDGYGFWGRSRELVNGIEVFRVPIFPRGSSPFKLAVNYLSFVFFALVLAPGLLFGRKYDVVFAYLPSPALSAIPAVIMSWLKRAQFVVWVQDLWPHSISVIDGIGGTMIQRLLSPVVRWIYRRADCILISSEAFREPIAEIMRRPSEQGKIAFHPNTFLVNGQSYDLNGDSLLSEIDDGFSIVFSGNIGRAQSIPTILRAAELVRSVPEVRIFLIGDGSAATEARREIARKGIENVRLCGRYPVEAMPQILERASALLIALTDEEVFARTVPSKLQAYISAGKPIIASINGEAARIVAEAKAGLVSPAGDHERLAASIIELAQMSDQERGLLGENGLAYFEANYDPNKLADGLVELLSDTG